MENHCVSSVLMRRDKVFMPDKKGGLDIGDDVGYHLDNRRLATFLHNYSVEQGIGVIDDLVVQVHQDEQGVAGLQMESGQHLSADLYVDCSGFASLLLGKTLGEPFISYADTLFCDRAVIGGWERSAEALHPYTTSETMSSGWCWQIEHEERINRGYVYASSFVTDEQAEREFRAGNPLIEDTSVVHFRSGRFERAWCKNVVAIGNSAGFVEPLEATAIGAICTASKALAETLAEAGDNLNDTLRRAYNRYHARNWDSIADFLAVHYKFNNQLDTEFWRCARRYVDLRGAAEIVDYYLENGPSQLWRVTLEDTLCRFRLDGYYTLLVGQKVPHKRMQVPTLKEREAWQKLQKAIVVHTQQALSVPEALARVHADEWQWKPEHFAA